MSADVICSLNSTIEGRFPARLMDVCVADSLERLQFSKELSSNFWDDKFEAFIYDGRVQLERGAVMFEVSGEYLILWGKCHHERFGWVV